MCDGANKKQTQARGSMNTLAKFSTDSDVSLDGQFECRPSHRHNFGMRGFPKSKWQSFVHPLNWIQGEALLACLLGFVWPNKLVGAFGQESPRWLNMSGTSCRLVQE